MNVGFYHGGRKKEVYREFSGRNSSRAVAWKIEVGLGA